MNSKKRTANETKINNIRTKINNSQNKILMIMKINKTILIIANISNKINIQKAIIKLIRNFKKMKLHRLRVMKALK